MLSIFKIFNAAVIFIFMISHSADAAEKSVTSVISLPLRINLAAIQNRINAKVPSRLATINQRQICVPAKWAKIKIPVGIEVYDVYKTRTKYRWLKTKITPQISCNISGYVQRIGPIVLSGSGGRINLSVPIYAQITAKKGSLQETAKAKATIFITITPNITPQWKVSAIVSPNFTWDKRPTLKLFGVIKITIGSKVEPKLRDEMKKFVAEIPSIINKLNIRSKVATAWTQLQDPIKISDAPEAYLAIKPKSVGFSGISIANNILNTHVVLNGVTTVTIGNKPSVQKVKLLPLKKVTPSEGLFNLNVPLLVSLKELQKTINSKLPKGRVINIPKGKFQGTLKIKSISVTEKEKGKLRVTVDIDYDNRSKFIRFIDYFNWLDTSGKISFEAIPKVNSKQNVIFLEKLKIENETNNQILDMLVGASKLPVIRSFVSSAVKYNYTIELTNGIKTANSAMNKQLKNGVKISGTLITAGASNLTIENGAISLQVKARGKLSVDVGL